MKNKKQLSSHLEHHLRELAKTVHASPEFVLRTKERMFYKIDNKVTFASYFSWENLSHFFKQTFALSFSFLFAFTLFNIVFFTTLQTSQAGFVGEVTPNGEEVYILRANASEKHRVVTPTKIYEGDTIEVAHDSHAQVFIYNGSESTLAENSRLKIEKVEHRSESQHSVSLALQKGTLETKVEHMANADAKVSIITSSGIVEAPTNADFSLSVNENGSISTIKSTEEQIKVIANNAPTPLTITPGETLSGDQVVKATSFTLSQSPVSASGAVLALKEIQKTNVASSPSKEEKHLENTSSVQTSSTQEEVANQNSNTILPLPDTTTIDAYQLGVLQEISSSTDIAQVKLQNVLKDLNQKNLSVALEGLRSYTATLDRIALQIANLKQINTIVPKQPQIKHLAEFTVRSYLTSINSAYTSVSTMIKKENQKTYYAIQQKLHHLARIEAILKSRIDLQSQQ